MTLLVLETLGNKNGSWQVELLADRVELASKDGRWRRVVDRNDLPGNFELVDLWGGHAVLNLPTLGVQPKLQFRLTPEQRTILGEWIGPGSWGHLASLLRRRYAFAIPIGVVFLIASIPLPGDPAAGIEPQPADPLTATLGAGLVAMWALTRWRPDPRILWIDSVWFGLLLLSLFRDILTGQSSIWWLLWGVVLVPMIHSGPREFRKFRHLVDVGSTTWGPPPGGSDPGHDSRRGS